MCNTLCFNLTTYILFKDSEDEMCAVSAHLLKLAYSSLIIFIQNCLSNLSVTLQFLLVLLNKENHYEENGKYKCTKNQLSLEIVLCVIENESQSKTIIYTMVCLNTRF